MEKRPGRNYIGKYNRDCAKSEKKNKPNWHLLVQIYSTTETQ